VAVSAALRNVRSSVLRPQVLWNVEQLSLESPARAQYKVSSRRQSTGKQ